MRFLAHELILAVFFSVMLHDVMYHYLGEEISCELPFTELNVSSGDSLTYNGSIKNIGSREINVRFSAEGLNHFAVAFCPTSTNINMGDAKPVFIQINVLDANPGVYNGLIYIWNGNKQKILKRIPITIRVKNWENISAKNRLILLRNQKALSPCLKR